MSFYRDKNGNGVLDVGTDTLLGTDTDGSNGWSLSLSVSLLKGQQQVTYTYFAQAMDSANFAGNVVSTTNTIKKSKVAAMVASRDRRLANVELAIATYFDRGREELLGRVHRFNPGGDLLRELACIRRRR